MSSRVEDIVALQRKNRCRNFLAGGRRADEQCRHTVARSGGCSGPSTSWKRVFAVQPVGRHPWQPRVRAGHDRAQQTGAHHQHRARRKQGITTPPGDPACNVSKSGVKTFTARRCNSSCATPGLPGQRASVHSRLRLHPAGLPAAVPKNRLARGRRNRRSISCWKVLSAATSTFCARTTMCRARWTKRIRWAAGDIVENRPPLSRWHPDFAEAFAAFLREREVSGKG